jgi:transcriptional regulator with XRE-family HTH domain
MLMAKKTPTVLAHRLRQLRDAASLSQQALATVAGLSISVVTQLEQGTKRDPRVSTVASLADALGVTVDELIRGHGGDGKDKPPKRRGK